MSVFYCPKCNYLSIANVRLQRRFVSRSNFLFVVSCSIISIKKHLSPRYATSVSYTIKKEEILTPEEVMLNSASRGYG